MATSKSLQQVLGYVTLTKSIKATTSGIPNPFPDAFFKATKNVIGNKGRYTRTTGERRTAPISKYGAAPRKLDLRDVGEVDVKLIHTFGEQELEPLVMKQLRSKNSYEVDTGLDEVKRQVKEFKTRFENLRIAALANVLKQGLIYYDANGNLLPTSSGAVETHSFNMNANNQNQLNGIIGASWALNNTDIPLQLRLLKKQARRTTGYPLKYAFYGEDVPSYLVQNDFIVEEFARSNNTREKWLDTAEIPDGLMGFTWIPAYEAFYEDNGGTNQDLWSASQVTFTPEVSDDWWEFIEGSFEVPTTVNIMSDGEAAMRSTQTVYGQGSYGMISANQPVHIVTLGFDTFIPCLKNPDVCFQASVAF